MIDNRKIIIVLAAVCCVALSLVWHWFRSRFLLQKWAKENGFELVKMNVNWFESSPFWFRSRRQGVFRIRVRDHRGRERSGWAKCGGYWLGFLVNKIEVEWD
jgi:hypothetical protein